MASAAGGIVSLQAVSKVYGAVPAQVRALDDITLTIDRGERVGLVGRSGSGKSTMLNVMAGLDRPSNGKVVVDGQDLAVLPRDGLARHRLLAVGMVFQSFNLLHARTSLENVELPLRLAGVARLKRRSAARQALAEVGLADRAGHYPAQLSGGECQRVALARALIHRPPLVLADEPTGSLDSATAQVVMQVLLECIRDRGAAFVLVTHDERLARECTDRLVRLHDGRLVEDVPDVSEIPRPVADRDGGGRG